jgi:hypothetical protein
VTSRTAVDRPARTAGWPVPAALVALSAVPAGTSVADRVIRGPYVRAGARWRLVEEPS